MSGGPDVAGEPWPLNTPIEEPTPGMASREEELSKVKRKLAARRKESGRGGLVERELLGCAVDYQSSEIDAGDLSIEPIEEQRSLVSSCTCQMSDQVLSLANCIPARMSEGGGSYFGTVMVETGAADDVKYEEEVEIRGSWSPAELVRPPDPVGSGDAAPLPDPVAPATGPTSESLAVDVPRHSEEGVVWPPVSSGGTIFTADAKDFLRCAFPEEREPPGRAPSGSPLVRRFGRGRAASFSSDSPRGGLLPRFSFYGSSSSTAVGPADFTPLRLVGAGAFGSVVLCRADPR